LPPFPFNALPIVDESERAESSRGRVPSQELTRYIAEAKVFLRNFPLDTEKNQKYWAIALILRLKKSIQIGKIIVSQENDQRLSGSSSV